MIPPKIERHRCPVCWREISTIGGVFRGHLDTHPERPSTCPMGGERIAFDELLGGVA